MKVFFIASFPLSAEQALRKRKKHVTEESLLYLQRSENINVQVKSHHEIYFVSEATKSSYLCTGRCRLSLSLHTSDQGGMDATVCESRVRQKKGSSESRKLNAKDVESIRRAEILHHCLHAQL